jgi:transcriptional regulator with XRE-family HTH domain
MLDADRIRLCRLKLRLSQQRLGDLLGQDQAYVSRLEGGRITDITVRTLEQLADVFGVSTDYLLGRGNPGTSSAPAPPAPPVKRTRKAAPAA